MAASDVNSGPCLTELQGNAAANTSGGPSHHTHLTLHGRSHGSLANEEEPEGLVEDAHPRGPVHSRIGPLGRASAKHRDPEPQAQTACTPYLPTRGSCLWVLTWTGSLLLNVLNFYSGCRGGTGTWTRAGTACRAALEALSYRRRSSSHSCRWVSGNRSQSLVGPHQVLPHNVTTMTDFGVQ